MMFIIYFHAPKNGTNLPDVKTYCNKIEQIFGSFYLKEVQPLSQKCTYLQLVFKRYFTFLSNQSQNPIKAIIPP